MAVDSDRKPPVRLQGLTGYRYLLAVLVLVALATVPMVLAVAAGHATLARPPSPTVEPFLSPVDHADRGNLDELADPEHFADHELTASAPDRVRVAASAAPRTRSGEGDADHDRSGGRDAGTGDTGWSAPSGSRMLW
jgi:hypothetical protein